MTDYHPYTQYFTRAKHEAAHVIVALSFGWKVSGAAIDWNSPLLNSVTKKGHQVLGVASIGYPQIVAEVLHGTRPNKLSDEEKEILQKAVLVFLAPQAINLSDEAGCFAPDNDQADKLLQALGVDPSHREDHVDKCRQHLKSNSKYIAAIEKLAGALHKHGDLCMAGIVTILACTEPKTEE